MNRRSTDVKSIIGDNLSDPFYDSYEDESLACCAIMDKMERCDKTFIQITFNRGFLKKIVHSHLIHIRQIQKDLEPRIYVH